MANVKACEHSPGTWVGMWPAIDGYAVILEPILHPGMTAPYPPTSPVSLKSQSRRRVDAHSSLVSHLRQAQNVQSARFKDGGGTPLLHSPPTIASAQPQPRPQSVRAMLPPSRPAARQRETTP